MYRSRATQTHILNCQLSASNLCPPNILGVRYDVIPLTHHDVEVELNSPQPNFDFAWNNSKSKNLRYQHLQEEVVCVVCMHAILLLHAPHYLFCKK